MRLITETQIRDIALGAALLGTGGGGDPHVGMLMAIQAIRTYGPIQLLAPHEVPADKLIVPTAMMGAPTVLVEKIPSGEEIMQAFAALQDYLGKPIFATMPIEAGGVNSMMPFAVAARAGLPVVDADGMGRAFPELQMVTFHLHDIKATPMVIADEKDNSILLNTVSNQWTEALARNACVQMGGSVMVAIYPMTTQQLHASAIGGIITYTQRIGEAIRLAKEQTTEPVAAVLEITGGRELFHGKVVDIARRTEGGFVKGDARFEGTGSDSGETVILSFQNENLIARTPERVLATVPDLIVVLDAESGHPLTTEGLRYGARAVIIGIPCDKQWRTPRGLETVGPRYFGYDLEYVPLGDRGPLAPPQQDVPANPTHPVQPEHTRHHTRDQEA